MRIYVLLFVILFLQQCGTHVNKVNNEKKLINIYKDYSFEEYVDLLLEENKSKDYPNIDSVE